MHPETAVVFTPSGSAVDLHADVQHKVFQSYQAFKAAEWPADFCLLHDYEQADGVHELLSTLRQDRQTSLLPIFSTNRIQGPAGFLLDQTVSGFRQATRRAGDILVRLSRLPVNEILDSQDLRLLAFLHSRQDLQLRPYRHWRIWHAHSYPLAESLADAGTDAPAWIRRLTGRQLLQEADLLDRVRHCPHCTSAHHNYIDVCPHCQDINIRQKPFIHCFTCGHTAPQDNFVMDHGLQCPNCGSRLKHIGADYDRPLENYVCGSQHVFIEPDAQAHCLNCGARNRPEHLEPEQVYAFELTEEGRLAAKSGHIRDIFAGLDQLNHVRPEYFQSMMQWLLELCRRHDEEKFSILCIRLINIYRLIDTIGRSRTLLILDEFASRIRELIRSTDLCTRTGEQYLWILLSKTECPDCNIITMRIRDLKEQLSSEFEPGLDFKVATFSAPTEMLAHEDAEGVMSRLTAQL